jgi:Rrf2 family protein
MKLSRTVVYAVQATLQLAEVHSESPVPCKRLAHDGKMPERFLLQILRSLVNHGILHSTRGVDGGYSLDRKPQDISLLDIIEAIEGPFAAKLPTVEGAVAKKHHLRLREALDGVAASARRQLAAIKLADLLGSGHVARLA